MLVMHADYKWREALIRFALIFMCFAFWRGGLQVIAFSLLVLAWVLDGGIDRFKQVRREQSRVRYALSGEARGNDAVIKGYVIAKNMTAATADQIRHPCAWDR